MSPPMVSWGQFNYGWHLGQEETSVTHWPLKAHDKRLQVGYTVIITI